MLREEVVGEGDDPLGWSDARACEYDERHREGGTTAHQGCPASQAGGEDTGRFE
jgi:hypothetical protein